MLSSWERVAWLECDLGQGEFSCGGVIGLWVLDAPVLGMSHPRRDDPLLYARLCGGAPDGQDQPSPIRAYPTERISWAHIPL